MQNSTDIKINTIFDEILNKIEIFLEFFVNYVIIYLAYAY